MSERLSGRAAVVTGAARGIGFAVPRRLGEEGTDVVLADVDVDAAAEAAEELAASDISTAAVECASATSLTARTPPPRSQRRSTASAASTSS